MTKRHHDLVAEIAARQRQADDYAVQSVSAESSANRATAAVLAANAVRDLQRMTSELRQLTAR